jgi:phage tail sheath protein FI
MPEYLAPGLFVEEIDSGSKPIEGVGTNTTAFIGYSKSGEFNTPTFISNWTQFVNTFGEDENTILKTLADSLGKPADDIYGSKLTSRMSWAEYALAAIEEQAILQVLADTTKKKTEDIIEDRLASRKSWRAYGETLISDRKKLAADVQRAQQGFVDKLTKAGGTLSTQPYIEGAYLAHAVKGFYDNGGGRAYIVRIPRPYDLAVREYKPATNGAAKPAAVAAAPAQVQVGGLVVKALPAAPAGKVEVEVEHVAGSKDEFRLKIKSGGSEELFGHGEDKPLKTDSAAAIKSKLVAVEVADPAAARPAAKTFDFTVAAANLPATTGTSNLPAPISVSPTALASVDQFVGDEAQGNGMGALPALDDVDMICVPDLMAGVWKYEASSLGDGTEILDLSDSRRQQILDTQCQLVAYCERSGDRMAILDPIPGLTPQQMRDVTSKTPYNSAHGQGTIYYPWIKIMDPLHKGGRMLCPPSGHIAGVWARTASVRGVHKAPANEAILGAVALERNVTKGEQEILNPDGINCIRAFPGTGIKIWGARTLATIGNPSWKYVNVRRLFNYLERSMERGLQWVVFEPNDPDLWGRVRRTLSAFLFTEWKEGKLFGTVPAEAYYVKCDDETNPQEMIDLGRLYVEIGVNPVKPAEFVIIRIGQWSSSSSVAEA